MPEVRLLELQAEGLGPISEARLEFSGGFNVLTGETGVGKTLLVGALNLCLGAAEARGLRPGANLRAAVLFDVDGAEISLAREIAAGGRLRGTIDGLSASAAALRERSAELIVIHGQHDSLRLRNRSEVLRLIDNFGGIDDGPLRVMREEIRDLETRRERFGGDPSSREREAEFLRFQLHEIEQVNPSSADELDETLEQLRTVVTLRDHQADLLAAIEEFDGDGDGAILARWAKATRLIPDQGRVAEIRRQLHDMALEVREVVRDLSAETDRWQLDPAEIERLESRAGVLQALARKYGGSLGAVLDQRDVMQKSLIEHQLAADTLVSVDRALAEVKAAADREAARLRELRRDAGQRFATAVSNNFPRVALSRAALQVSVEGDDGSSVELRFSPDPSTAPGALQAMASGGELARVLLAISLETVSDGVVAVFDEIDSGVGGSVAQQIGECLHELAQRQQVIVVTHLASIAARADRHFVVEKNGAGGAVSNVRPVIGDDRVSEIARMLAGDSQRRESRALAERLLNDS
jgi:DNA repair protein RecN (Recombination protein N)